MMTNPIDDPALAIAALAHRASQCAADILADFPTMPNFYADDAIDELRLNLDFASICADALIADDAQSLADAISCDESLSAFAASLDFPCIHAIFAIDDASDFPLIPSHCSHGF